MYHLRTTTYIQPLPYTERYIHTVTVGSPHVQTFWDSHRGLGSHVQVHGCHWSAWCSKQMYITCTRTPFTFCMPSPLEYMTANMTSEKWTWEILHAEVLPKEKIDSDQLSTLANHCTECTTKQWPLLVTWMAFSTPSYHVSLQVCSYSINDFFWFWG